MNPDSFRYDGKRALVVGGATGMGAATAKLVQQLGSEVVVMDFAPVTLAGVKAISLDLRDKGSIDAAVDECGGPIDALFSCAGAADGTPGIEKINFIGHRHLIDRAIDKGFLDRDDLVDRRAGVGEEPAGGARLPRHPRLRQRGGLDRGARSRPRPSRQR